jgi:hypothetical protein
VTTTLQASAPGTLSVTASAKVAPQTVRVFEPTSGTRVQRVVTPDTPDSVTDKASLELELPTEGDHRDLRPDADTR